MRPKLNTGNRVAQVVDCPPSMAARILDGKALAAAVRASVKETVARLAARGVRPGLAVILAGDNPASAVYVRNKVRACEETGVRSEVHRYGGDVTERALLDRIAALNSDPAVHGILVQLPLPGRINARRVLEAVAPAKDIDGFHLENLGALVAGQPKFVPCTPAGVMRLIEHAGVTLAGTGREGRRPTRRIFKWFRSGEVPRPGGTWQACRARCRASLRAPLERCRPSSPPE